MNTRDNSIVLPEKWFTTHEAFELIREQCWRGGRPLVPLFGAGISVDSGIPAVSGINRYLERLTWYLRKKISGTRDQGFERDWLRKFGWPEYHGISRLVLETCPGYSLARVDQEATQLLQEMGVSTKWWELLNYITQGDAALKDLLFDRLVYHAKPAASHHYAAFLAAAMNWPVILTTNFDTLLESTFREHGLATTVYSLPESQDLPDGELVRANRAIIKMHGDAFGLLAGAILDVPLDYRRQQAFLDYIPPNALLIVVGYGGGDVRVMHLLSAYCRKERLHKERIVWVARDKSIARETSEMLARIPGLQLLHYRDGGAFLQEMYSRLTTSYAVTSTWYRALSEVPPRVTKGEDLPKEYHEPVVIFCRKSNDYGTSSALARHVRRLSGLGFSVVWCHLEHLPTVDSLIANLQQEFRKHDRSLPPFSLFRAPGSTLAADPGRFSDDDPRIQWIVDAMYRGRYVIAFDSVGEFGQSLFSPSAKSVEPSRHEERRARQNRLHAFFDRLVRRAADFGDSRIAISWSPFEPSYEWSVQAQSIKLPGDVDSDVSSGVQCISVSVLSEKESPPTVLDPRHMDVRAPLGELFWPETSEVALKELTSVYENMPDRPTRKHLQEHLIFKLWGQQLKDRVRLLLVVATVCRRSRSIVAIRDIVIPIWRAYASCRKDGEEFWETLDKGLKALECELPLADLADSPGETTKRRTKPEERRELDTILLAFEELRFMLPQEGGFVWMHRLVVESLRQIIETPERQIVLTRLHSIIANYYYERVFCSSRDRAAFVEYLRHRGYSLQSGEDDDLVTRLRHLDMVLKVERDQLLSQRQADTVLGYVEDLKDIAVEAACKQLKQNRPQLAIQLRRSLRATLCDLEAEVKRQKSDFYGCICKRCEQIADKLYDGDSVTSAQLWRQTGGNIRDAVAKIERAQQDRQQTDELAQQLRNDIEELRKQLVEATAIAKDLCSHNQFERMVSGFRILEHTIDIAACLTGLDEPHCTPTHVDSQLAPLQGVHEVLSAMLVMGDSSKLSSAIYPMLETRVVRGLVRCCFRQMEQLLMPITPWNVERVERGVGLLHRAKECYQRGVSHLRMFSGFEPRDHLHYRCFLSCLRARAAYLEGDYLYAHQLLVDAESAVSPPLTGSERAAVAVCSLHRAELLMLDADWRFRTGPNTEGSGQHTKLRLAERYLSRSQQAIKRARELLHEARPHLSWWTWLCWLEAQCEHECLLLEIVKGDRQRHAREQYVRNGLRSLRMGFECARQSPGRHHGLRVLLWQFAVVYLLPATIQCNQVVQVEEGNSPPPTMDDWKRIVQAELRGVEKREWGDTDDQWLRKIVFKSWDYASFCEEWATVSSESRREFVLDLEKLYIDRRMNAQHESETNLQDRVQALLKERRR